MKHRKIRIALYVLVASLAAFSCFKVFASGPKTMNHSESSRLIEMKNSSESINPNSQISSLSKVSTANSSKALPPAVSKIEQASSALKAPQTPSTVSHRTENKDSGEPYKIYGEIINIKSSQLQNIKANTTYKSILEQFGYSANFGYKFVTEYSVDNDKLLILRYKNPEERCPLSGSQLLQTAVPLVTKYNNLKEHTGYCVVVEKFDSGLLVSNPQYQALDATLLGISDNTQLVFENGEKATMNDIKVSKGIVVTHDKISETTYPAGMKAFKIVILK